MPAPVQRRQGSFPKQNAELVAKPWKPSSAQAKTPTAAGRPTVRTNIHAQQKTSVQAILGAFHASMVALSMHGMLCSV